MQIDIVQSLIDYIWVPIVTALTLLWSKLAGIDTRAQLLTQACASCHLQRAEEKERRDEQRREILDKIDQHHNIIMRKLEEVDRRVKNGH